jgi:outer membrane cobalamin receptor
MRCLLVFSCVVLWLAVASAAELKIKVVDPQSAAIAGAQVELLSPVSAAPAAIEITSGDGTALFRDVGPGPYHIQVLAPGFAAQTADTSSAHADVLTVKLRLAPAAETVVVTATRGPVPNQVANAEVAMLSGAQLEVMQPAATGDALRFLPGAIVNNAGQRGGFTSLFVRGGDSRYNKVLMDDVPVDEPGGTFNFGVVPLTGIDRLEFLRGAQSTLYGSDAMTSVVQLWTRNGNTRVPELRFGADGGNLDTAHGYLSLSGARGPFDYNLFGDQFNTSGQGVNDDYSNSLQGGNIGVALSEQISFRLRARHSNSRVGVPGEWNFNGQPLLPPDHDARARQNTLLGSAQLAITGPSRWQHRLTGFEYNTRRLNRDDQPDRGCDPPAFDFTDCFFSDTGHINRAGLNYQGDYTPVIWAQSTFGYEFEDENGVFDSQFTSLDSNNSPFLARQQTRGLRLNHAVFFQQRVTRGRFSGIAGFRYVHNDSFGDRVVPRAALTFLALRGSRSFSGTRLRFAYGEGIKEPRFEESFGIFGDFPSNPNPNLKAEENRSLEAGVAQSLLAGKYAFSATYFNNLFRNQIALQSDPATFVGQYVNINRSLAHGAEVEFNGRPVERLTVLASYVYTSTQILEAPLCTPQNFCSPLLSTGEPLIRRPKHSGSLLLTYLSNRWGGNLGGSFVGRRADSDFLFFNIRHAAGYARVDVGGWYALSSRITAYLNVENALNKHYEEVVGYPALGANFRVGMRFRLGGE